MKRPVFKDVQVIDRRATARVTDTAWETRPEPIPVTVSGAGHDIAVQWNGVAGANDAEVDAADLQITRAVVVHEAAQQWPLSAVAESYEVTVPDAPRVRSLTLEGLKSGTDAFSNATALDIAGLRLLVSVSVGGEFGPPLYAVPSVRARGVMPPSFRGATFSNNVLTLPDVAATKIRLTLVKEGFPEDVTPQPMKLTKVLGRGATPTRDLTLTDSTGAVVWSYPGEVVQAAPLVVDLRHAIEKIVKPNAKEGKPLAASFNLKGVEAAHISFSGAKGAVVRRVPGVIVTELAGEARPLIIPTPPLAADIPSRAIADVTVRYHGLRLLEPFIDAVPAQAGGIAGLVVSDASVVRKLPPAALIGFQVAKLGIIGRAPVDCELVVQLFDFSSGVAGEAVTLPATQTLTATNEVSTIWLDVPKHEAIDVPVVVVARTNHGRFFWAAAAEPLLRIAVFDPDPGGRPVRIGGSDALPVIKPELHAPAIGIDARTFAGTLPLVDSLLFATVDVSDLRLEYDR